MNFILARQFLVYVVENTIDKLAALRGTIRFCQVNILVYSNFCWYGFKKQKFTNTHVGRRANHRGRVVSARATFLLLQTIASIMPGA